MSLFYLFTRYKFNWSEVEFSLFSTYSMGIHLIGKIFACNGSFSKFFFSFSTLFFETTTGTAFSVSIFSSWLKIDDAIIGAMSSISKVLSSFVYAFSQVEWQLYLGPIADIVGGTTFIAMRSLASKIVSSDELGKINSIFGIVESIAPLIYSPVLAAIYAATLTEMTGAFFLVGGLMTIPGVGLFM